MKEEENTELILRPPAPKRLRVKAPLPGCEGLLYMWLV